jgi:hypothetical protein
LLGQTWGERYHCHPRIPDSRKPEVRHVKMSGVAMTTKMVYGEIYAASTMGVFIGSGRDNIKIKAVS